MKLSDVGVLPVVAHMAGNVKRLRRFAPRYVQSVAEDALKLCLPDVNSLRILPLTGGMSSANYLIESSGCPPMVIKLMFAGALAEAEALAFWRAAGARAVPLIRSGIVPMTKGTKHPVKYLILEAVVDGNGRPAPTCQEYVDVHPHSARTVGCLLGRELALMHRWPSHRTFGEYADQPSKKAPYASWNKYLLGYLDAHQDYLLRKRVAHADIDKLRRLVRRTEFAVQGCYIHGDFSLRNTLLASRRPLEVVVIDPNPVIGDPSWDLAILYNNYHFEKRKAELDVGLADTVRLQIHRDCLAGVIESYEATAGQLPPAHHILLAQIMQTLFLARTEERKLRLLEDAAMRPTQSLEVRARVDNLLAKIQLLVHLE